jgi:hypothetical protein
MKSNLLLYIFLGFLVLFIIYKTNNDNNFRGYECTQDCGGHKAGYEWAKKKGLSSKDECSGKSESFIEGCYSYVKSN